MERADLLALRDRIRERAFAYKDAGLGEDFRLLVDLGTGDEISAEARAILGVVVGPECKTVAFPRMPRHAIVTDFGVSREERQRIEAFRIELVRVTLEEGAGCVRLLPAVEHLGKRRDLEEPFIGGDYRDKWHPRCLTCERPVDYYSTERIREARLTRLRARCHGAEGAMEVTDLVERTCKVFPRFELFPRINGKPVDHRPSHVSDAINYALGYRFVGSPSELARELKKHREQGPGIQPEPPRSRPAPSRGVAVYCQSDEDGDV